MRGRRPVSTRTDRRVPYTTRVLSVGCECPWVEIEEWASAAGRRQGTFAPRTFALGARLGADVDIPTRSQTRFRRQEKSYPCRAGFPACAAMNSRTCG